MIAHVVNDRAAKWGAGFAGVLGRAYPSVQKEFIDWSQQHADRFRLGTCHIIGVKEDLSVISMIAQHGYGPSPKPRIRYNVLAECLDEVAKLAAKMGATVHMPRIGCGQAGGCWEVVNELVESALCKRGVRVTVYDLPGEQWPKQASQSVLFPS